MTLQQLSCCTGFPVQVLVEFAQRGILPRFNRNHARFDGKAMLRTIEEITNHAR